MSFLAYDPTRMEGLERTMSVCLDELTTFRRSDHHSDPVAAAAIRAVRAIHLELVRTWLPLVRRVRSSDALTRPLEVAVGLAVGNPPDRWSVVHDPYSTATSLTAAQARALAVALNDIDVDVLADDPDQLGWLAAQLGIIARDPVLARAFLADFREWADLCDALGGQRAALLGRVPADIRPSVAVLDAVFTGLAHVQRTVLQPSDRCLRPEPVVPQIDEMNPYSAALVISHLGLDGTRLAHVTHQLLTRWLRLRDEPHDFDATVTDYDLFAGPNTADILFTQLAQDPAACSHFLSLAVHQPDILFTTAADPATAHRVVLLGTRPGTVEASEAGRVIVPILDYFAGPHRPSDTASGEPFDEHWPEFLADLVSPWTMQLAPENHDWSLTEDHQAHLVAPLVEDDAAITRLIANATIVRDGVHWTLEKGDSMTLERFSGYFGLLGRTIINERVRDEQRAAQAWALLAAVVSVALSVLPLPAVVTTPLNIGQTAIAYFVEPDHDRAAHDAAHEREYANTCASAAVAAGVVRGWIADGTLPEDFPPPPAPDPGFKHPALRFREAFNEWLKLLPGGFEGSLADRIDRLAQRYVNAYYVGESIAV